MTHLVQGCTNKETGARVGISGEVRRVASGSALREAPRRESNATKQGFTDGWNRSDLPFASRPDTEALRMRKLPSGEAEFEP